MAKRSLVWDFYDKNGPKIICKQCKIEVKSSKNTSNMIHHLNKHHPDIYLINFTKHNSNNQNTIDVLIQNIVSTKDGDLKSMIDQKLLWWIINDGRSFNICESSSFKAFLKSLNSNYTPPGRKAITEKMNKLYESKKELVLQHLKLFHSFTLTTDLWSDTINTRSYIGLTIHYIDDYVPMKLCLAAKDFPFNHTAKHITDSIKETLLEFEIENEEIFASVTDSASNMVLAMKDISKNHIGCVAHKINLLVMDSVQADEKVVQLITKIRMIVTFFKQSNKASLLFTEEQIKDNAVPLKLKQDVQTRWNSSFLMIERFVKLRDYVSIALRKSFREDMDINYSEMEILLEIKLLLQPFYQMTADISGEKYVTVSRVIPLVTMITNLLNTIIINTDTGKKLKATLQFNLEKRFGNIEKHQIYAFSTLLDPRFKKIDFRSSADCALAVSKLNSQLLNVTLTQPVNMNENSSNEMDLWSLHNNRVSRLNSNIGLESSLQHYFELKNCDLKDDPFMFWKKYKENFHHLHNLALLYLNIPATSVPCERLFSKTGSIITDKRNRIKPCHVNNICFLESLPDMFR